MIEKKLRQKSKNRHGPGPGPALKTAPVRRNCQWVAIRIIAYHLPAIKRPMNNG
jgi:hypothetical protein